MTEDERTFFTQMIKALNDKMGELLDAITVTRDDLSRRISRLEDEMRRSNARACPGRAGPADRTHGGSVDEIGFRPGRVAGLSRPPGNGR